MKKTMLLAVILCAASAFGWNCTTPGQVRVQVPTGTVGSGTGDGSGQVVVDSGLTFICEALPTATTTPTTTNSNTNNSASNSTSGASSTASATGGNSSVNSSVNNTNNLSQSQKQQQQQTQSQSNTSTNSNQSAGGSVSNVGNSVTTVEAPKIPVASAYAPTSLPSAPCVKGFGGGVQTMAVGGSFGGSKIDAGCDAREFARSFALLGARVPACKMLVQTKQARKAGITMEECLATTPAPVVQAPVVIAPPVAQPAPSITINVPPTQMIYLTVPHEEVTVTAPALGEAKPAVKKRVGHPCKVPPSLSVPMEK